MARRLASQHCQSLGSSWSLSLVVLVLWYSTIAASSTTGTDEYRFGHRSRHVLEGPFLHDQGREEVSTVLSKLVLSEIPAASTGSWSGHRVWPGAVALVEHLHLHRGRELVGLRIVELGCGLPFMAAALAALGAEVCATDHPDALHLAEALLVSVKAANGSVEGLTLGARQRLKFRALAWGQKDGEVDRLAQLCNFSGPVDLVVGADLVYDSFPWEPLRDTVVDALRDNGAIAVLALQPRKFPMVSALGAKPRVKSFLQSLAAVEDEGGFWEVKLDRAGADAQAQLGQTVVETLILATVTPPRARERAVGSGISKATSSAASSPPLRYRQEPLLPLAWNGAEGDYRAATSTKSHLEL